MTNPNKFVCPRCGRRFPKTYWGVTGRFGGFGTVRKPGLARANFKRHARACRRKQTMIGRKLCRLDYAMSTGFVIREYEVTKETPKYLWVSPRNVPNERSMEFSEKIKRDDSRFRQSKRELISVEIKARLAKIEKAKSAIESANMEIEALNNIGR